MVSIAALRASGGADIRFAGRPSACWPLTLPASVLIAGCAPTSRLGDRCGGFSWRPAPAAARVRCWAAGLPYYLAWALSPRRTLQAGALLVLATHPHCPAAAYLPAELQYPSGLFRKPLRVCVRRVVVNSAGMWRPGAYLVLDTGEYGWAAQPACCDTPPCRDTGKLSAKPRRAAAALPFSAPLNNAQPAACCAWSPPAPRSTPTGCSP